MNYDKILNKKKEMNNMLKQSNKTNENPQIIYSEDYKKGVLESFDLFKSIVEFYDKYKSNVKLLMQEQNNLWKKWVIFYNENTGINKANYNDKFNKWLFENLFSEFNNTQPNKLFDL